MKIASMTSSFYSCRDREGKISQNESIRRLKDAGFEHVDLHLCGLNNGIDMFCSDDWERKAHALREDAEKLGVTFVQSHAPYNPKRAFAPNDPNFKEHVWNMQLRSLEISKICGVPNTVIHPLAAFDAPLEDTEAHVRYNYEFYEEFLNRCDAAGICACFENLPLGFGTFATQLLELLEAGKDHNVAACWDFGHGALIYPKRTWSDVDQTAGIRLLKDRIRAVHVHDNFGKDDNHLLPFLGNIQWEKVLPALREAGFTGDLVLEIKQNANMPYELMDESMKFCAAVSKKLIKLFEGGK